jgi:chromatin remodeling complex protein RSC6
MTKDDAVYVIELLNKYKLHLEGTADADAGAKIQSLTASVKFIKKAKNIKDVTPKKEIVKKVLKKATPKRRTSVTRTPNAAFMQEFRPSVELAAIVGARPLARTEVVKKLWAYIKKHKLQDPRNNRNILTDEKLKPIFGNRTEVSMFELASLIGRHLS